MKIKHQNITTFAATLIAIGSLAGAADGSVSVTSLGGDQYFAEIGTITFDVRASGFARLITVEDFYVGPNTDRSSEPLSTDIFYSLNGAPSEALRLTANSGSFGGDFGFWDANDFVFSIRNDDVFSVSSGDRLVFTGSFTFQANGLTAPAPPSGDLTTYLASSGNSNALAMGTVDAVPEPSSSLLAGLGAFALLARRRRLL